MKKYAIASFPPFISGNVLDFSIQTGYTSKGSSGSGVYSKDHKLVGINITGANTCENPRLEDNLVVPFSLIGQNSNIKSRIGNSNVTNTFNPNFSHLPEHCIDCIASIGEEGIDCGGPCRPCYDAYNGSITISDNNLPRISKAKQNILVDGSLEQIALKPGNNMELYAQGFIQLKGTVHINNGSTLIAKTTTFFPDENRGCKDLCSPAFPNVFTPNGDGMNDKYIIIAANAVSYEFIVYDRNMKQIYYKKDNVYTNQPFEVWDGKGLTYPDQVVYVKLVLSDCTRGQIFSDLYFVHTYSSASFKNGELISEEKHIQENPINFSIYPNPSRDIINVSIPSTIKDHYNVEIYNSNGQLISKRSYYTKNLVLDISSYSNGNYYLKLFDNNYSIIEKFIKSN